MCKLTHGYVEFKRWFIRYGCGFRTSLVSVGEWEVVRMYAYSIGKDFNEVLPVVHNYLRRLAREGGIQFKCLADGVCVVNTTKSALGCGA